MIYRVGGFLTVHYSHSNVCNELNFSLWLNEGFASYVETIGAAHVEPDASIMERFCIDNTYDTMEIGTVHK